MKFKRHTKIGPGLATITIVPLVDVIFQLLLFFMLTSSFTAPSGITVKLPKAITSDVVKEENYVVTLTSEDVMYLNNRVITIKGLQKELDKPHMKSRPVLIKADRRASVGRIVDVWNLCRNLGIERINIATTQNR